MRNTKYESNERGHEWKSHNNEGLVTAKVLTIKLLRRKNVVHIHKNYLKYY